MQTQGCKRSKLRKLKGTKGQNCKLKGAKVQRSRILQNFNIAVFNQSIPEFRGTLMHSFCTLEFASLTFCTLPHAALYFNFAPSVCSIDLLHPSMCKLCTFTPLSLNFDNFVTFGLPYTPSFFLWSTFMYCLDTHTDPGD